MSEHHLTPETIFQLGFGFWGSKTQQRASLQRSIACAANRFARTRLDSRCSCAHAAASNVPST